MATLKCAIHLCQDKRHSLCSFTFNLEKTKLFFKVFLFHSFRLNISTFLRDKVLGYVKLVMQYPYHRNNQAISRREISYLAQSYKN